MFKNSQSLPCFLSLCLCPISHPTLSCTYHTVSLSLFLSLCVPCPTPPLVAHIIQCHCPSHQLAYFSYLSVSHVPPHPLLHTSHSVTVPFPISLCPMSHPTPSCTYHTVSLSLTPTCLLFLSLCVPCPTPPLVAHITQCHCPSSCLSVCLSAPHIPPHP